MASGSFEMGHIVNPSTGSIRFEARCDWTSTPDTATNSSTVTATIYMRMKHESLRGSWSWNIIIAGSENSDASYFSLGSEWTYFGQHTTRVAHDNEGNATCHIRPIVWTPINKSMIGTNVTVTLDKIARKSEISTAHEVILGNNCNVSWDVKSASFYYKLKFYLGNWEYTTPPIYPNRIGAYTCDSYTIPVDVATQLPNSDGGAMNVELTTYADSACTNRVGTSATKTFNVYVPDNIIPSISNITAIIDNSGNSVINSWGVAVAGYTKVRLQAIGSGSYGASVNEFHISGSHNANVFANNLDYVTDTINNVGNNSFNVYCTDSRNRNSASKSSEQIFFYSYSYPKILSFYAKRDISDREKVHVRANWNFSSVNSKNSSKCTLYYKSSVSETWIYYGTIDKNVEIELTKRFDVNQSFNFKIIVEDLLSHSAEGYYLIPTKRVLIDLRAGGQGLGIGKVAESDSLEVELLAKFFDNAYFNKDVYIGNEDIKQFIFSQIKLNPITEYIKSLIDTNITSAYSKIYDIGSVYISFDNTSPAAKFGGSWEKLNSVFLFASDDGTYHPAGECGGEWQHTLTPPEMPYHEHNFQGGFTWAWGTNAGFDTYDANSSMQPGDGKTNDLGTKSWLFNRTAGQGGGQPHNNMPPYISVNIWKRLE